MNQQQINSNMQGWVIYISLLVILCGLIIAMPAYAQKSEHKNHIKKHYYQQVSNDKSFITFTGTIKKVEENGTITVDLRRGEIMLVNMTGPKFSYNKMNMHPNDHIIVTAEITSDLFNNNRVSPLQVTLGTEDYSSVYTHPDYRIQHYRNSDLGKEVMSYTRSNYEDKKPHIFGRISAVIDEEKVTLNYQGGSIIVEIDEYDLPEGKPIQVGEYVAFYGDVDSELYQKKEFRADRILRFVE